MHAGYPPRSRPLPPRSRPPRENPPLPGRPPAKETPSAREIPCQGDPPARETLLCQGDPPPGPHQGETDGIRSRPTPKEEFQGDQIQAHTQGGNSGGSDPGPHPRGKFRGIRSRPTSPLMTSAAGGTYPTGMHSCFCLCLHLCLS